LQKDLAALLEVVSESGGDGADMSFWSLEVDARRREVVELELELESTWRV
jgi:hypothetical protein